MTKLEQVKALRKQGFSNVEIGRKLIPPVTGERVRQILKPTKYWKCKKHKQMIEENKFCPYCTVETTYPKKLELENKKGPAFFAFEAKRLSKQNRDKCVVLERTIFIKFLKDKQHIPLTQVSRLLERDYTSIKNLYMKKI